MKANITSIALPHNAVAAELAVRVLFFEECREFDQRGQPPRELEVTFSRTDSMEVLEHRILAAARGKGFKEMVDCDVSLVLVELSISLVKGGRACQRRPRLTVSRRVACHSSCAYTPV